MTQVPGYRSFGGVHPDTAALKNLLAQAGGRAPHSGKPLTEAAILGIAGGIGAGVASVSRHLAYTFDGTFHRVFLDRVGLERTILEASSASAGQKKAAA